MTVHAGARDDEQYDQRREYTRCLECQLSDDEVATLNRIARQFADNMKQMFGARAETALYNLIGLQLANLLKSEREGGRDESGPHAGIGACQHAAMASATRGDGFGEALRRDWWLT